ncbi:hypothetical protein [Brevibacillus brevis]|uniref:hypothetical protein n=1 Tax=Brevibacillus brevis TaxID=1393 RepID=UPI0037C8176B
MRYSKLNELIRDEVISRLLPEQKDFIDNQMRRGKRTQWLNIMAEIKGISLIDSDDYDTIVSKVGGWVLSNYQDRGVRDQKCECGRPIRHVYHVTNLDTRDELILGSKCIQDYTNLDAATVGRIKRGMESIDLERDEILRKIEDGWRLPFFVPDDLELPTDIREHLSVGLPLLDRQVARLNVLLQNYARQRPSRASDDKSRTEDYQVDLFTTFFDEPTSVSDEILTKSNRERVPGRLVSEQMENQIPHTWINAIERCLKSLTHTSQKSVTALDVANIVANELGLQHDRYLTGKPRTYYLVALYLDEKTYTGNLELVSASHDNRLYTLKNHY